MRALGALCQESEAETNTYFFYYFTTTIPTKLLLPNSQIYLQAVKAQSSIPRCLLFDFHPPHYRVIHLTSGKPLSPAFPLISLAIFFSVSITGPASSPQYINIDILLCWAFRPFLFSFYPRSLDNLIQLYGFIYHLYADNSQIYNPRLDISPELQIHTPKHLLSNFT